MIDMADMKAALLATILLAILAAPAPNAGAESLSGDRDAVAQIAQRANPRARRGRAKDKTPQQNQLRIAAVVNNEVITIRDLSTRMQFVMRTSRLPDRKEIRARIAPQILRALIEERLKMQEAKRLGIKVSRREIGAAIARIERANKIPPGKLTVVFRQQGIDPRTVIEQIQAALAWNKVVLRRIRPRIRIAEDEVREYLDRVKANQGRVRFRVSEIYLVVDSPDQEAQVRQTAQRLFDQIKKGVSFARIARQFSQSATARTGGDLGWIDQGALRRELDQRLRQMKPGHVAGPIRTVGGYYILALRERRVVAGTGAKDATVSMAQVLLRFPAKATEADRNSQRSLARTISETASGCADMEKLSKELGATGSARLKNVKVASLAPALRRQAGTLAIGKAGRPVETKTGVVVMMVCSREGLADRRRVAAVRRALANRQLDILTRRYLRDLRRSAYLDLRV